MNALIWPLVNFSILVGILVLSLKKPLASFVADRHTALSKDLAEAKTLLELARKQKEELEYKMNGLEKERAEIRDRFQLEVTQTIQKAVESAERLSKASIRDARLQAEQLMGDFKREMLNEVSKKIVERAEFLIKQKVTQEDATRMTKELSKELD